MRKKSMLVFNVLDENATNHACTVDMVYIILKIQNEFGISIGDEFIKRIQNTTMNNLIKTLADVLL